MKWIGQNIWDQISRFRNDVYLESISTGTIASGAHLGLDSNNKIVKAADGGGDLTSIVAGTGLSGTSLTGPIPTLNVDASQTQITSVGTIGTGVWQGTTIKTAYIGDDQVTEDKLANTLLAEIDANTAKVTNVSTNLGISGSTVARTITSSDGTNAVIPVATTEVSGVMSTEIFDAVAANTAKETNSDQTKADINALDITEVGTISSGVWQGTRIASLYLDIDTAHLTSDQTFTGVKTFDETIVGNVSGLAAAATHVTVNDNESTNENNLIPFLEDATANGNSVGLESDGDLTYNPSTGKVTATGFVGALTGQADTVATIAGLAPNTATTQATQPAIESIGTDGDTLNILADTLLMSNTSADTPVVKLVNTTDDDQAGQLIFEKLRDDDAVAVGQNLGEIWFRGQDSAQNTEDYAYIIGEIDVSTSGQESGELQFGVAGHDGSTRTAMRLTGGSEATEVDATIGLGVNSVVTIPGNIDLAGDIDVDGTLEVDAFKGTGSTTITNILDEDAMGSNSATALATQQSIKAYADTKVSKDTTKQLTHHTIVDDIDATDVVYISLGEIDAENTTSSNKNLPLLAPVAGKLLKVFVRTSAVTSGVNLTFKLYTRTVSQSTNGTAAEVGAKTAAGPTNKTMVTYDFTSSEIDSGTNAIAAGDKVLLSVESSGATSNQNIFISCLWEWDLS